MHWIAPVLLVLSGSAIICQDLKARLISLWLILLFGISNVLFYLHTHSVYQLLENVIFCTWYLMLSYGVLLLYFYIKTKRFEKIINSKFGMGDVLVMLLIGVALEPVSMIYFFSGALVAALFFSLLFFRKNKSIPLAGLLIICYLVLLTIWAL